MTLYEKLTLLIVVATAFLLPLIRWVWRERKRRAAQGKADVVADLVKVDRLDYKFVITNRGPAHATAIDFRIAEGSPDNPLAQNEVAAKLPYPRLDPGQSFDLLAGLSMDTPPSLGVRVTWRNADGSQGTRETQLSW